MTDLCPCCAQPLPPSDKLVVSLDENCILFDGRQCALTVTETDLMFVLNKGGMEWVDSGQIFLSVYGGGDIPSGACLRTHMTHIRHKLDAAGMDITIESTQRHSGEMNAYRLRLGN